MSIYELLITSESMKNELYSLKIDIKYFTKICNEYNLIHKGEFKEYYLGNKILIKNDKGDIDSISEIINTEIIDKNIQNEKELLQLEDENNNLSQFYKTDSESIYNSYENEHNGIRIICKKYSDYITLSIYSHNKDLMLTKEIKNKYY